MLLLKCFFLVLTLSVISMSVFGVLSFHTTDYDLEDLYEKISIWSGCIAAVLAVVGVLTLIAIL